MKSVLLRWTPSLNDHSKLKWQYTDIKNGSCISVGPSLKAQSQLKQNSPDTVPVKKAKAIIVRHICHLQLWCLNVNWPTICSTATIPTFPPSGPFSCELWIATFSEIVQNIIGWLGNGSSNPVLRSRHFFGSRSATLRVGHSVLFYSVRYVLFRSKKRTFRSFLEFLATYETQKNVPFFSVLF